MGGINVMKRLLCVLLASAYVSSFAAGTAASSNLSLSGSLANNCVSNFSNGGATSFVNFIYGVAGSASSTYTLICNPTAILSSVVVTSTNNGILISGANSLPYTVAAVVSGGSVNNQFVSDWSAGPTPNTVNTGAIAFESGPGTTITAMLGFDVGIIPNNLPAGDYTDTYSINANY